MMEYQIAIIVFETDHKKQVSVPLIVYNIGDSLDDKKEALRHFEVLRNAIEKGKKTK